MPSSVGLALPAGRKVCRARQPGVLQEAKPSRCVGLVCANRRQFPNGGRIGDLGLGHSPMRNEELPHIRPRIRRAGLPGVDYGLCAIGIAPAPGRHLYGKRLAGNKQPIVRHSWIGNGREVSPAAPAAASR